MAEVAFPSVRRLYRGLALFTAMVLIAACAAGNGQSLNHQSPQSDNRPVDAPLVPPDVLKIPQFPVPPNASVVLADTVIVGDDEDWSGQVFLTAPYTVVQITQFYRAEMPKSGWIETAIVRSRRTSVSYTRGNRVATLRLVPQRGEDKSTDIDLVVSPIQTPGNAGHRSGAGGGSSGESPPPPSSSRFRQ